MLQKLIHQLFLNYLTENFKMIAITVLSLSYLIFAVYVIPPANARVINKRAAFYIANETMCIVDGEVFRNGDPVPTDDHCERCTCRPPGFSCVLRDCEVKPGCKAVRRAGECCPEYVCGCVHSGNIYEDGEIIRDIQNPCYTCRCHGSSISCVFADCLFRGDCAPEYVVGECCPRYDHCPPLSTTPTPTVFTTTSPHDAVKNTLNALTTLHLEKFTGENTSISIEDIQSSPPTVLTSTTPSTTPLDETKVTVKFIIKTTTDSSVVKTTGLISTITSWLSAFTEQDSITTLMPEVKDTTIQDSPSFTGVDITKTPENETSAIHTTTSDRIATEIFESQSIETTEIPTVVTTEIHTVVTTEIPTVVTTEIPTVVTTEIPTVVTTEIPTVVTTEIPTVVTSEIPAAVTTEIPIISSTDSNLSEHINSTIATYSEKATTESISSITEHVTQRHSEAISTDTVLSETTQTPDMRNKSYEVETEIPNFSAIQGDNVSSHDATHELIDSTTQETTNKSETDFIFMETLSYEKASISDQAVSIIEEINKSTESHTSDTETSSLNYTTLKTEITETNIPLVSTETSRLPVTNSSEKIKPRSSTTTEERKTTSHIFAKDQTTLHHNRIGEYDLKTTISFGKFTEKSTLATTEKVHTTDFPETFDVTTLYAENEEFRTTTIKIPHDQNDLTSSATTQKLTEILEASNQTSELTSKETASEISTKQGFPTTLEVSDEMTEKIGTTTTVLIAADDKTLQYLTSTETPEKETFDKTRFSSSTLSKPSTVTEDIRIVSTDKMFTTSNASPHAETSATDMGKTDETQTEEISSQTRFDSFITTTTAAPHTSEITSTVNIFDTTITKDEIKIDTSLSTESGHFVPTTVPETSYSEEDTKAYMHSTGSAQPSEMELLGTKEAVLIGVTTSIKIDQPSDAIRSTNIYSDEKDISSEISTNSKSVSVFTTDSQLFDRSSPSDTTASTPINEISVSSSHELTEDDTTLLADEAMVDILKLTSKVQDDLTTDASMTKKQILASALPQTTEIVENLAFTEGYIIAENGRNATNQTSIITSTTKNVYSTIENDAESFNLNTTNNINNPSTLIILNPSKIKESTLISSSSSISITEFNLVNETKMESESSSSTVINENNILFTESDKLEEVKPITLKNLLFSTIIPFITENLNSTPDSKLTEESSLSDDLSTFNEHDASTSTSKVDGTLPDAITNGNIKYFTDINSIDTTTEAKTDISEGEEISNADVSTAKQIDTKVATVSILQEPDDTTLSPNSLAMEEHETSIQYITSSESNSQTTFKIETPESTTTSTSEPLEKQILTTISKTDNLYTKPNEITSAEDLKLSITSQTTSSPLNDEYVTAFKTTEFRHKIKLNDSSTVTAEITMESENYDTTKFVKTATINSTETSYKNHNTRLQETETNLTPTVSFVSDINNNNDDADISNSTLITERFSSEDSTTYHTELSTRTSKEIEGDTALFTTTKMSSIHDYTQSTTDYPKTEKDVKESSSSPIIAERTSVITTLSLQTKATQNVTTTKNDEIYTTKSNIQETTLSIHDPSILTMHKSTTLEQPMDGMPRTTVHNSSRESEIFSDPNYIKYATIPIEFMQTETDGLKIEESSLSTVHDEITNTVTNFNKIPEKFQTNDSGESWQSTYKTTALEESSPLPLSTPVGSTNVKRSTNDERDKNYISTTVISYDEEFHTEDRNVDLKSTTNSSSIFDFDNLPIEDYYTTDYDNPNESNVDEILDSINLDRLGESIIVELMRGSENITNRENETFPEIQAPNSNISEHVSIPSEPRNPQTTEFTEKEITNTNNNDHLLEEALDMIIKKEMGDIYNETLSLEINDTIDNQSLSDVWYGMETTFNSRTMTQTTNLASQISTTTEEYTSENELLQDEPQNVNHSPISNIQYLNAKPQSEEEIFPTLMEESEVTSRQTIEHNFTKTISHMENITEKTFLPDIVSEIKDELNTFGETKALTEVPFETTNDADKIYSYKLETSTGSNMHINEFEQYERENDEMQTTERLFSINTITEDTAGISEVASGATTASPEHTTELLDESTYQTKGLTIKKNSDFAIILSETGVTDSSSVDAQIDRQTSSLETNSEKGEFKDSIIINEWNRSEDNIGVPKTLITSSSNENTLPKDPQIESHGNFNITPSPISLNENTSSDIVTPNKDLVNDDEQPSLADEELQGPEKGGEWFEPTFYSMHINNNESTTTSNKIHKESISALETTDKSTTTIHEAPITYEGINDGPEKGREWFEPKLPAYYNDKRTEHLTTEFSKHRLPTRDVNQGLSGMEASFGTTLQNSNVSQNNTQYQSSAPEVISNNTSIEHIKTTLTPSYLSDTSSSQKSSTNQILSPLPILRRTEYNVLNPVFTKESLEKFLNAVINNPSRIESSTSHKLGASIEVEEPSTKSTVTSTTMENSRSNVSTKLNQINFSKSTTESEKAPSKLSKIYHVLLSKDPASDLIVSSVNNHGGSSAKGQFLQVPQDIPLIEGFAVKSGDFFAVTSSLIVVDPNEKKPSENETLHNTTDFSNTNSGNIIMKLKEQERKDRTIRTDSENENSRVPTFDSTTLDNSKTVTKKEWVGA